VTTLVQISDLHFGAEDPVLARALEEKIAELAPDALAVSGDLTQKGRREEFEAAARYLGRLPYPKLIAPGNHDTPLFNIFARLADPFARHHKRMAPGAVHRFRGERIVARTLNTARGVQLRTDWSLGAVDLDHAAAVAADLASAPPHHARTLVCHHPLVSPAAAPFAPRTRRGDRAARLLSDAGVDLVLTGHLHVEFAEPLPGGDGLTWAIGSGTALSRRLRGTPAGFNAVTAEPDRFIVRIFHSGGRRFDLAAEHVLPRRAEAAA
jgi:3',5'-cyclic AMP phosphodiesterase CpdA